MVIHKTPRAPQNKKLYVVLFVTCLIGVVALFALTRKAETSSDAVFSPFVRTYTIDAQDSKSFQLTGTVQARVESNIGFRVSGKITKRLVDLGQSVKRGQELMVLDAVDLELAQKAAQAEVVAAKADNLRALKDELRQKALVKIEAVSQQNYELAKALADSTTAKLLAVEANAKQADNQVQYSILRADADGVVSDVMADTGQVVGVGQAVITLAQNDTREAVVDLPETMISNAKDAQDAFLYSDPTKRLDVSLRELSATADPVSRTFQARYTLKDEGQGMPLGATVTVSFAAQQVGLNRYRVPIAALYDNGNGSHVWIVDPVNSTVHLKDVTIVELGEELASVSSDLSAGDKIVALGVHLLKDNQKVLTENAIKKDKK